MSGSQVSNFVNQFYGLAQQISAQTGLAVDYILGQAGLESGWGTSNAAVNGNNYFGISPGGSLASYDSPAAGFAAYGNLINGSNYSGVIGAAGSGAGSGALATANYLNGQGYSTTPNYGSLVQGAVNSVDQVLGGAPTASGGSPTASAGGTAASQEPAVLSGLSSWLGTYAKRGALILISVLLLLGAVYLFASRTQEVQNQPA